MNPRNCSNRKSSIRPKKENANDKLLKWIKYFENMTNNEKGENKVYGRLKGEENKKWNIQWEVLSNDGVFYIMKNLVFGFQIGSDTILRENTQWKYIVIDEAEDYYCNKCEMDYEQRRQYKGYYIIEISDEELLELQRAEWIK